MIEHEIIESWFRWLIEQYPTENEPELTIAPSEYLSITADNENFAFGVFIPSENRIICLSNVPDEAKDDEEHCLFTTLAHEYGHHLQMMNSKDFDEDEVEGFAENAYAKWKSECSA